MKTWTATYTRIIDDEDHESLENEDSIVIDLKTRLRFQQVVFKVDAETINEALEKLEKDPSVPYKMFLDEITTQD